MKVSFTNLFYATAVVAVTMLFAVSSCKANVFNELQDPRYLAIKSSFETRQFSSFDRKGGNDDAGNYLAVQDNRWLLADISGPGEILRVWSANPNGKLEITLDDQPQPYYSGPFLDIFHNRVPPFLRPISTSSSGGEISYFPISFARKARIEAVDSKKFYYHVTYRTYPEGNPTASASVYPMDDSLWKSYRTALQVWENPASLEYGADDPIIPVKHSQKREIKNSFNLAPGRTVTFAKASQSGYFQEMRLLLPLSEIQALRKTRLVMYWDNCAKPGVDSPLLDYFGSAFSLIDHRSILTGRTSSGWWYIRFPMPFKKHAEAKLINYSDKTLTIHTRTVFVPGQISPDFLYYRTTFHAGEVQAGKPFNILYAKGSGQFAGTSISIQGLNNLWFLEGDELISVDGRSTDEFNGTGTEDYFNSGWYFKDGTVSQPLHGCILRDIEKNRASMYRYHLTDRIPFKNEFRFDLEHGGNNDVPGAKYYSVAHWYSISPGDAFTPPVQIASLNVTKNKFKHHPNAVALSKLAKVELSGGRLYKKDWGEVSPLVEGGTVLLFKPASIGNAITLKMPISVPDKYRFALWLGKGPGLGRLRVSVNSKVIGEFDCWSSQPNQPELAALDEIVLKKGMHDIRFQVIGKNPASAGISVIVSHLETGSASEMMTGWRILGPFDGGPDIGHTKAYIPEGIIPDTTTTFVYDGKEMHWSPPDQRDGVVLFSDRPNSVWYAVGTIEADEDCETEALAGSDDTMKIWINGRLVHDIKRTRALQVDEDHIPVKLKRGTNTVMVKVTNGALTSGFCLRFRDPGGMLKYQPN